MRTIFDSILLNSLQMETSSQEATLGCTVFESGRTYRVEILLSHTGLNQLLNEVACRGIELDFDTADEVQMSNGESIYYMRLDNDPYSPIFLPSYALPEQIRKLRA